ncbi:MAG: hypothetical protein ACKOGI_08780 [Vulcanococcus sp.]|nr:hypothetical protein [Cyanobacteria bacterium M_DeepCast_200m_mx_001]
MASPRLLSLLPMALGGLLLTTGPAVGLSLDDLQSLNRELGRLCSDPPRQALAVCRIHARLVRAM